MMKLYYSPHSCALAAHIVATEAGVPVEPVRVDLKTKTIISSGADFLAKNPKGYVPALELDDGEVLTESSAVLQYLADLKPEARLAPANGLFARVRLQEALNYISSEIHKGYAPLFNPTTPPEARRERSQRLLERYALLDAQLAGRMYLFGEQLTVADAYLFVVTLWAGPLELNLASCANLEAFQQAVARRPAVQASLKALAE
jgi:glutathione S-transferase